MKNKPRHIGLWMIGLGSIMLVFLLVIIVPKLAAFWNAPLGPELGFEPAPGFTLQPTKINTSPTEESTSKQDSNPASTPTSIALPTYTPDAICGDDPEMLILAIGIDYRKGTYTYGLADVIRLVKVDFVTPRVTVLTLPRDFWVEVPGISDHYGITHAKLNQSYFYGTEAMGYYDGPGGGAGLLARTIELNFGAQPEHYGVVNMNVLIEMIDAIGGVDIYLEQGIDARDTPESDDLWKIYKAGWNHLNGKRAVYYARIRHIDNVFGRTDRQTEILCAVKNKLLSPDTLKGIPEMITAFSENVLTDLSPAQLSQLACLAPRLSWENIVFARLPEDEMIGKTIYNPNMKINDFIWDMDNAAIRRYVTGFLDGSWPPPPVEGETDDAHEGSTQQLCPVYPDR
ncbi:MAG: LCP family protein [Anaerolineales bacterium]|nr:LCP family protein [Anaerolineales bacterium]